MVHDDDPPIFHPGDPFRQHHYVVVRFLGAGASGQVFEVEHRFTHDHRALKVYRLESVTKIKEIARRLLESQASYRIQHENVVRVFDLGCEDDGLVWQVQELLEGRTVDELIRRGRGCSPIYAIDLVIEAAWGLHAAHEERVIHRDVRPANLFVTSAGVVKVLDFSLAKILASPLKTTQGRTKGTAGYMGPEQIKGVEPNPQFDVYALGMVWWELLAGRHPFETTLDNAALTVTRQLGEEVASLVEVAGLPAYCDEVVRRAVAKDPGRRYATMWDLAQAALGLRERLLADPAVATRVRYLEPWERSFPIVRGTEGNQQYRGPRALPEPVPAPPVPSARVYVTQPLPVPVEEAPAPSGGPPAPVAPIEAPPAAAPAEPWKVAVTVPMAAVNLTPTAVAAPLTVRRGPPRRSRWPWVALGALGLAGVGFTAWWLGGGAGSKDPAAGPPPAPSPSSSTPPRASSASVRARPSSSAPAPSPRTSPPRSAH